VYVETLDRSFESVCELDLIFNSPKARPAHVLRGFVEPRADVGAQAYAILDEIVMGGAVFETSSLEALRAFNETQRRACAACTLHSALVLTRIPRGTGSRSRRTPSPWAHQTLPSSAADELATAKQEGCPARNKHRPRVLQ
jgi:hypothetical protein